MRGNNELLISKTALAREWITKNVELSTPDLRRLDAHINYFCAIHSYLDGSRMKPLRFIFRAIAKGGVRFKYLVLLAKIIAGRKLIVRLANAS
jgi:hypothetical protein